MNSSNSSQHNSGWVIQVVGENNTITLNLLNIKDLRDKVEQRKKLENALKDKGAEEETKLILSEVINKLTDEIDLFKQNVLETAKILSNIKIDTERLKKAKAAFDKGLIKKANKFLNENTLFDEQKQLLQSEKEKEQELSDIKEKLLHNSNEYLFKAQLTILDFSIENRIEKAKEFYKLCIESNKNTDNLFAYAYFLQQHIFFDEAIDVYQNVLSVYKNSAQTNLQVYSSDVARTLNNLAALYYGKKEFGLAESEYQEALEIYRSLSQTNPQVYLSAVASTLNNLGILHSAKNELGLAEEEYQEALAIIINLSQTNPTFYLTDVALTLYNLAVLHSAKNELGLAEEEYQEALAIRRYLVKTNPQVYLPDMAMTLNNLANLYWAKNELGLAETGYQEALEIYKPLSQTNPQVYLTDVALTLYNLAILHSDKNELELAEAEYQEALAIRRNLAKNNPQVYLLDVAMTLINISIFYINDKPNKALSISSVKEALLLLSSFSNAVSSIQKHVVKAMEIVVHWGFSIDELFKDE